MRKRLFLTLVLGAIGCATASAQQMQTITFVSDYWVRPGKEDGFQTLVKTVGAPVRDKLMAEGVIFGWGIDVPLVRAPGQATHSIWYTVAGWDGVEQVQSAMRARQAELADQDRKAAADARRRGQKAPMSTAERIEDVFDTSRTKDWIFRDLAGKFGAPPAEGALPLTRVYLITAKPGKYTQWRATFDKHIKPTLDQLVDNGTLGGWGLGTEEVKTTNDFTHYIFISLPNLAAAEKMRNAFVALQAKRSAEENEQISQMFNETSDATAARSFILRATIFKIAPPK